jgi:hypothetical protein
VISGHRKSVLEAFAVHPPFRKLVRIFVAMVATPITIPIFHLAAMLTQGAPPQS